MQFNVSKYLLHSPILVLIVLYTRRLSIIDVAGVLTVTDISEGIGRPSAVSDNERLERKDVWAMCWAGDNPQLLAIMEKTRMYIFKGNNPEEPISSSGYLCSFQVLLIFF